MSEKRSNPRTALAGRLRMTWLDTDGGYHRGVGHITDISATGVQVSVPERIASQTTVQILLETDRVARPARVRHCTFQGRGFHLGLEFHGWRWCAPVDHCDSTANRAPAG